jgi:mersacidin/lichenicidin family type 2 lantibiotic
VSKLDIVRAWRDPEYRSRLSDHQRAMLPDNPAGSIALSDSDLDSAAGGTYTFEADCQSFPGVCTCIDICPFTAGPPLCPEPFPFPILS